MSVAGCLGHLRRPLSTMESVLFQLVPGTPRTEFKFPKFDDFYRRREQDEKVSQRKAKDISEGLLRSNGTNKDGQITREEWDAMIKYMSAGKNSVLPEGGSHGDITKRMLSGKDQRNAVVPSASSSAASISGERRSLYRIRHKVGKEIVQSARGNGATISTSFRQRQYLRCPLDDGAFTVLKAGTGVRGRRRKSQARRRPAASDRRRHDLRSHRESPIGLRGKRSQE